MPFFRHFCALWFKQIDAVSDASLRNGGLVALLIGVVLVWMLG